MRWMASALLVALVAVAGRAESGCTYLNRAQADRAVEVLGRFSTVVGWDWFEPIAIGDVRWEREGFLYKVVVNGETVLDLRASYVPEKAGSYRNLGELVDEDCAAEPELRLIPREPLERVSYSVPTVGKTTVMGIVEIPALFGWYERGEKSPPPIDIPVYVEPHSEAERMGRISAIQDVESAEFSYEQSGALVYAMAEGWYKVELKPPVFGWIRGEETSDYHALSQLILEGLDHLTDSWNGYLFDQPRAGAPGELVAARRLSPAWREHFGGDFGVEALSVRALEGEIWFEVRLLRGSLCSSDDPQPLTTGWIPAHAPSGETTIWFSSRGC